MSIRAKSEMKRPINSVASFYHGWVSEDILKGRLLRFICAEDIVVNSTRTPSDLVGVHDQN